MSYHVNLMFSKKNWGTGRAIFQGSCCSATGQQSDCRKIWVIAFASFVPVSSFFHLINELYLDPPVLWLIILPVPSCSPPGPAAVWVFDFRPWWTHHSVPSVQEVCDHNTIPICFLCSDEILQQTLAKTRESLIFLLSVSITVNQWAN